MKKLLLSLLIVTLMFIGAVSSENTTIADILPETYAAEIIDSGTCGYKLTWTIDAENTLTISGEGEMISYNAARYYPWSAYSNSIEKIVIGSAVTKIGCQAFMSFSNVTEVIFEEDSKLEIIDSYSFDGNILLNEIQIPASVVSIGHGVFANCTELEKIIFDKNSNLQSIGSRAFEYSGITEIEFPASLVSIDEEAFRYCSNLVSVSFEENSEMTSLGGYHYETEMYNGYYIDYGMFAHCESLKNVSLPDGIAFIGAYVFNQCPAIEVLDLAKYDSLVHIDHNVFASCTNLKTITLPEGLNYLGKGVFRDCEKLTEITIPGSIEAINKSAFSGCLNLSEVTFAENSNVQTIGDGAFTSCIKLQDIQLPENLTYIDGYAFDGCKGLTEIEFPEKLEYVGDFAFIGTQIKEIHLPASVSYFGAVMGIVEKFSVDADSMYFSTDENGVLYTKDMKMLVLYPSGRASKEFVIPYGVETIKELAFPVCFNLEKVIMPDTVTELAPGSFAYAFFLKEIVLSQNLEKIGGEAFAWCFSLEHIDIPASVTEIGAEAFMLPLSLTEVKVYSKTLDLNDTLLGLFMFSYENEEERELIREVYFDVYYHLLMVYDEDYIIEKYGSVEEFYELIGEIQDKATEFKTDAYTVYCYKDSVPETYLKENNIKYAYLCDHIEELIPSTVPTCTKDGTTEGIKCSVCGDILIAPEKNPMKGHTPKAAVKENEVDATCKVAAYYEDVVYCDVCGDEISRTPVIGTTLPHKEETIPATAPTCTKDGTTAGVKCSVCGDILTAPATDPKKGHNPVVVGATEPDVGEVGYTGDTICSVCGTLLAYGEEIPALEDESKIECEHMCHQSGFMSFIWKLINFFQKLFGINPVCECGAAHY